LCCRPREALVARLFDPDDVDLRTSREAAVELYQRRNGLLLVDRTSDLRCSVVPMGDRLWSGFDRAGVLVRTTATRDGVLIGVATSDDLDARIATQGRVDGSSASGGGADVACTCSTRPA
jgi:hypothetical protein